MCMCVCRRWRGKARLVRVAPAGQTTPRAGETAGWLAEAASQQIWRSSHVSGRQMLRHRLSGPVTTLPQRITRMRWLACNPTPRKTEELLCVYVLSVAGEVRLVCVAPAGRTLPRATEAVQWLAEATDQDI